MVALLCVRVWDEVGCCGVLKDREDRIAKVGLTIEFSDGVGAVECPNSWVIALALGWVLLITLALLGVQPL
jgi:hypothetical protein